MCCHRCFLMIWMLAKGTIFILCSSRLAHLENSNDNSVDNEDGDDAAAITTCPTVSYWGSSEMIMFVEALELLKKNRSTKMYIAVLICYYLRLIYKVFYSQYLTYCLLHPCCGIDGLIAISQMRELRLREMKHLSCNHRRLKEAWSLTRRRLHPLRVWHPTEACRSKPRRDPQERWELGSSKTKGNCICVFKF